MPLDRRATLILLLSIAACGGPAATPGPAPVPIPSPVVPAAPSSAPALPPVPEVDGPLAIRVQYPSANQVITSRDSNFIFGQIGSGRATLMINGAAARVYPNGSFMGYIVNPPESDPRYDIVVARGGDTVRSVLPIRYPARGVAVAPPVDSSRRPDIAPVTRADTIAALNGRIDSLRTALNRSRPIGVARLGAPSPSDSDRTIVGRPIAAGTYKWFFSPGTIVPVVAREGAFVRVRLDDDLDVYVDSAFAAPTSQPVPRRTLSNMRVRGSSTGADVTMLIGSPAPYFVEEHDRSIVVTLHGVRGNTDLVNYATSDSMVKTVEWVQVGDDRVRVTVNLRAAPFGYLMLWEGSSLVLKLRGRPAINASRPLAGLTIAVDPGHPPAGSTGPTGLREFQATLPISVRLKRMLEERGATVVMTRTDDSPVALEDRPIIARRANAHAFVSIHLNALPDGVNPFRAPGTGTYFFRTHSEPLAREVQRGMVAQIGLMDLGINYNNLAVVRGTWYPSVLCEGAFIMMPDQEAALRTPEFQERYARGVADGLEAYFRKLGSL